MTNPPPNGPVGPNPPQQPQFGPGPYQPQQPPPRASQPSGHPSLPASGSYVPTGPYQAQNVTSAYPPGSTDYPTQPMSVATTEATAKKKSRIRLVVASALALVLIVGAGAFAVFFFRGAANPAEALPADADVIAKVELNPSNAKKLDIYRFFTKFPFFKEKLASEGDFSADPRKVIFNAFYNGPKDYDTEIKPWLGDSMGFALKLRERGGFDAVIAIHTIDIEKAKEFVKKEDSKLVVDSMGDFLLLTQKETSGLIESAKNNPLSKSESYQADMKNVGDGVVTLWADQDAIKVRNNFRGKKSPVMDDLELRVALALDFTPETMELRTWSASNQKIPDGDNRDQIGNLPAESSKLVISGISDKSIIEKAYAGMNEASRGEIGRTLKRAGFKLPEDLTTALGDQFAFVSDLSSLLDGPGTPDKTNIALISKSGDSNKQKELWERVARLWKQRSGGAGPVFTAEGDTSVVSTNEFGKSLLQASGSKLSDDATYKAAVDTSNPTTSIFFLKADPLIKKYESEPEPTTGSKTLFDKENLELIGGIGMSVSKVDDNSAKAVIRLTTVK